MRPVVELISAFVAENEIGAAEVIFPIELVAPPRATKPSLSPEELEALGSTAPVRGRTYRHGTLGGYVKAKCRCEGCREWTREYGRERMRKRRSAEPAAPARRWAKSRDADEPYPDEGTWDRIWKKAVKESGIPLKPTAYQVRHTHASWFQRRGGEPEGRHAQAGPG